MPNGMNGIHLAQEVTRALSGDPRAAHHRLQRRRRRRRDPVPDPAQAVRAAGAGAGDPRGHGRPADAAAPDRKRRDALVEWIGIRYHSRSGSRGDVKSNSTAVNTVVVLDLTFANARGNGMRMLTDTRSTRSRTDHALDLVEREGLAADLQLGWRSWSGRRNRPRPRSRSGSPPSGRWRPCR